MHNPVWMGENLDINVQIDNRINYKYVMRSTDLG